MGIAAPTTAWMIMMVTTQLLVLLRPTASFVFHRAHQPTATKCASYFGSPKRSPSRLFSTTSSDGSSSATNNNNKDPSSGDQPTSTTRRQDVDPENLIPPWSFDLLTEKKKKSRRNNVVRVRQHVNPLARRFQLPTLLSDDWPLDVYEDKNKPLFLDIGAGKGGFLLELASQQPLDYNYLGLEIRPLAVQFAQERRRNSQHAEKCTGHLDFVGCNANVDLKRLLALYQNACTTNDESAKLPLEMLTIQFPDPHFKASHAKRRVVTPELVQTLPAFMPPGAKVFLQSDVQNVLDDMRERFREASIYFQDETEDINEYYPDNILGVPTEREVSVLKQDLPVYRALFIRTNIPYDTVDDNDDDGDETTGRDSQSATTAES